MKRTKPQPRLHPESWGELRQLVKLHGYDQLHAALEYLKEGEGLERLWLERYPIVTEQTVWERGDYCQLCGQRIDDAKPCGCGARRET